MERAADQRIAVATALEDIRNKALLISNASKENSPHLISSGLPTSIMGYLKKLSVLSTRDDAERLLGSGISMWNSVVSIDKPNLVTQYREQVDNQFLHTIVRLRHVACDCIMIASAVLDFVSTQYNISEKTVAKFYTVCGSKYMAIEQPDVAETCFSKAAEYLQKARKSNAKVYLSDVSFQLLLARSECMWSLQKYTKAHDMVKEARKHVTDENGDVGSGNTPKPATASRPGRSRGDDQIQHLANIMYNFAVFEYREGNAESAIEWIQYSIETREMCRPAVLNKEKQSKATLLAGVCQLSLKNFNEARASIEKAMALSHDPIGKYLLLKIGVLMRSSTIEQLMTDICDDHEATLSLCLGAVAIVAEGEMMGLAAAGYSSLFYKRFQSNAHARLANVGPRFLKALIAVGRTSEACKVLDTSFGLISQLQTNPESDKVVDRTEQGKLWTHLAISEGCNLVEKKDYKWAVVLLDKALSFARNDNSGSTGHLQGSNEILDGKSFSEAAVCRVLASSAFACISVSSDAPTVDVMNVENGDAESNSYARARMIEIAKTNAARAQEISPDDFSSLLLLFRIFLLENQPDLAAKQLRKASAHISSFDVGDFADAACFANDRGASTAVLAALGCIVEMQLTILQKSLTNYPQKPREGFFGSVLVSMVKILMRKDGNNSPNDENSNARLLSVLQSGIERIRGLGLRLVFGNDEGKTNQSLKFLGDVAWNCGIAAGMKQGAISFSTLSYEFHSLRDSNREANEAMQSARVMEACALTEDGSEESLVKAKKCYEEARKLGRALEPDNARMREKILIGIGRCYAALKDDDALACFVEDTCQDSKISVQELQQLALVCRSNDEDVQSDKSESKARRNEMACLLLNKAVDRVLESEDIKMDVAAMMLRELIVLEKARGGNERNGLKAFERATGLAKERTKDYPIEELRWLAATAWDQAELLKDTKQELNAKCWIDLAIEMASLDSQLHIYVVQMKAMKSGLEVSAQSPEIGNTAAVVPQV